MILSLSPLPPLPPAPDNRLADDDAAAALGQALFFDARLSGGGTVSCSTCHQPERYFTDGRATAVGVGTVTRHAPSVLGAAWAPFLTWDGRKDSLWSQALQPIEHPAEMASHRLLVVMRLRHAYPEQVERLFGPVPPPLERALARSEPADAAEAAAIWATLTPAAQRQCDALFAGAGKVIAAYQRHLAPRPAPFDAYAAALRAGDPQGGGLLSEAAVRGLRAFVGEAGCVNCHNGPLFTDFAFHNLGLVEAPGLDEPDPGRARGIRQLLDDPFRSDGAFSDARSNPELDYLNANFEDALGAFKTPSLRNVAQTAPYGHAGQFTSLVEVLEFYRRGGGEPAIGHADPLLGQIGAEFSVTDVIAFLESLTGPPPPAPWGTPPEGAADG